MKISENAYNLIHLYLTDKLTDKDKALFEEYRKKSEFRNELSKQSKIIASLDKVRDKNIRNFIGNIDAKNNSKKPQKQKTKSKLIPILLASLLFISLVIFSLLSYLRPTTNEQIFAEFYRPYPVENFERSADGQNENSNIKAIKLYANDDFNGALNLLDTMELEDDRLKLYKAICLIETRNLSEAKIVLNDLSSSEKLSYREEAEWYIALIHYKNDDRDSFQIITNKINTMPLHRYYNELKKINLSK